jgi:hypothetical protein
LKFGSNIVWRNCVSSNECVDVICLIASARHSSNKHADVNLLVAVMPTTSDCWLTSLCPLLLVDTAAMGQPTRCYYKSITAIG